MPAGERIKKDRQNEGPHPPARSAGGDLETFTVAGGEANLRLDLFLAGKAAMSRARSQRAIADGLVKVEGNPAKPGRRLKEGERVDFRLPEMKPYHLQPEEIPLDIVYEDPSLLVVNKPAGLVVHPAFGHPTGTLVNGILAHCGDLAGIGGVLRPGIVHRLDKDTSGLLVVAKTETAHQSLVGQFKRREVEKLYFALVYGDPAGEEGMIDLPVGRDRRERKNMSTRTDRGKEALTRWRVLMRYGEVTLLEVALATGRTHQIRVHLSAKGHPLVGDQVYGGARRTRLLAARGLAEKLAGLKRQALHARFLAFSHPESGARLSFSSELPPDLKELLSSLRQPAGASSGSAF